MKELPPLDQAFIRGVPQGKRRFCSTIRGLGIKHSMSGLKTWIFQAPLANGEQTTVQLGRVGIVTIPEAVRRAQETERKMYDGIIPNAAKKATIRNNVERLVLDYITIRLPNLRKPKAIEAALKMDWLGYEKTQKAIRSQTGWRWEITYTPGPEQMLRRRPIIHVTKTELLTRLDQIRAKRGSYAARRAMSAIRAAFAWAAEDERYGLKSSPATGLKDRTVGLTEDITRRERDLTDNEIRAIWEACGQLSIYGTVVRLLFLTGSRREEIGGARTVEIDGDKLIVPKSRFKGKRPHAVPLVPLALQLLSELPQHENCPFVFSVTGRRAFSDYTKMKRKLDELSGVTDWQLRDIRRTVRTRLGKLGVPEEIAERVIGHAMTRLVRTYDVGDYFDEKKAALEKWADALQAIVSPPPAQHQVSNVIPLAARRRPLG